MRIILLVTLIGLVCVVLMQQATIDDQRRELIQQTDTLKKTVVSLETLTASCNRLSDSVMRFTGHTLTPDGSVSTLQATLKQRSRTP